MTPLKGRFAACLAAIVVIASSVSLGAQASAAPSSIGAVLLLAGKDDAATLAEIKAALVSSDPEIRATAARVVGTGVYPTLLSDLIGALAREQDSETALEMLRDVLWAGGDSVLQVADGQSRRLGPRAALVIAEWVARVSPQKLIERVTALAATIPDVRGSLRRILEMGAAQHPDMADAFEKAWETLAPPDAQPSPSPDHPSVAPKWTPSMPSTAALARPIEPSLMTSLLQASSCKPARDRAGLAGIVFRPDGRAAKIELGSEHLPPGCVAALGAIARTTVLDGTEPVAAQMKYIVVPFTEAFAACTAAVEKHLPAELTNRASPPGRITAPQKTHDVRPVYPPAAQRARIEGTVLIEADLATPGCVASAHVIKSVSGLDVAALWAVSQWEYSQTLLNGKPVPVVMMTTVNFRLQ